MKTREQKDKSIAIAWDILSQLKVGTIVPRKGCYIKLPECAVVDDDDLQKSVAKLTSKTPCEVCAKGAIAVSVAKLYDSIPGGFTNYEECDFRYVVSNYFTHDETAIAERFFEGWLQPEEPGHEATARAGSSKNRLAMIASNIIRNKGELDMTDFRLEDAIEKWYVMDSAEYYRAYGQIARLP